METDARTNMGAGTGPENGAGQPSREPDRQARQKRRGPANRPSSARRERGEPAMQDDGPGVRARDVSGRDGQGMPERIHGDGTRPNGRIRGNGAQQNERIRGDGRSGSERIYGEGYGQGQADFENKDGKGREADGDVEEKPGLLKKIGTGAAIAGAVGVGATALLAHETRKPLKTIERGIGAGLSAVLMSGESEFVKAYDRAVHGDDFEP